jgi:predicted MPP superfamily phosphohydrolase
LNDIEDPWEPAVAAMGDILPLLGHRPLGILGNHDFADMIEPLETVGLRILMNDSVRIDRDGSAIWICGVDDPHIYRTHDLAAARKHVPSDGCAILLSHSPETYLEASALGYAFHLSGHTHGGQICLPGGIPVLTNARVPRRLVAGSWRQGEMVGYTSRGAGGSAIAARLFCPPEITLHTLRCVD